MILFFVFTVLPVKGVACGCFGALLVPTYSDICIQSFIGERGGGVRASRNEMRRGRQRRNMACGWFKEQGSAERESKQNLKVEGHMTSSGWFSYVSPHRSRADQSTKTSSRISI